MKRHYKQRKLRQLKAYSKRISKLMDSSTWATIDAGQKKGVKRELKQRLFEVCDTISRKKAIKILGRAALIIGLSVTSFNGSAQVFNDPVGSPFGLVNAHGTDANIATIDIDNDGDYDLFVSDYDGDISYYQNTGTALTPVFAAGVQQPFNLQNQNNNNGGYSSIAFCDIDGDGDMDLFTNGYYGDSFFYENIGTATVPNFSSTAVVNAFGMPAGYYQRQTFADIDNDGDLDLFQNSVGGSQGNSLYFIENIGNTLTPDFSGGAVQDPFGFVAFDLTADLQEYELNDIDNDGDLDLFIGSGSYGNLNDILYYENIGTNVIPDFSSTLQTNPFGINQVGTHKDLLSPELVDIDGDGDYDLLFGDFTGLITFQENLDAQLPDNYEAVDACYGDNYTFQDNTSATILTDTIQGSMILSSSGMIDSLVTTWVNVIFPEMVTEPVFVCPGSNYTFPDSVTYTNIISDTTHSITLTAINGCDSIITYEVSAISSACAYIVDISTLDSSEVVGYTNNSISSLNLGYSVAKAGDVNGDGIDDVIVGGRGWQTTTGRSYVIYGGNNLVSFDLSTVNGTNGFELLGVFIGGDFGFDVAGGNDINGDGYDDLIIGAPEESSSDGAAYVVYGGPSMPSSIQVNSLNGTNGFTIKANTNSTSYLGASVAMPGDVNGDGYDDILIGLPWEYDVLPVLKGATCLIYGGPGIPSNITPADINGVNGIILYGYVGDERSGQSVNGAGDINNDGFPDLVIGGPAPQGGNTGNAYVVFGAANLPHPFDLSTLNGSNGFALQGIDSDDWAGWSVNSTGDINDDGLNDLIVSARYGGTGISTTGQAYVVYGRNTFSTTIYLNSLGGVDGFTLNGINDGDKWNSVSGGIDWNHDGVHDLIIGAGSAGNGHTYVIYGKSDMPPFIDVDSINQNQGVRYVGENAGDFFGNDVSCAGDFNNDGYDDIIVGAPGFDSPNNTETGKVYIIYSQCISTESNMNLTICSGEDYTYPDGVVSVNVTAVESHISTLTTVGGCDSIVTTNVAVIQVDTSITTSGGVLTANELLGDSYQWIDCNNNSAIFGATTETYTVADSGSYAVEISANGCIDTSSCYNIDVTALEDYSNSVYDITIYPNPSNGDVFVEILNISSFEKVAQIEVFDIVGKQVNTIYATSSKQKITLPNDSGVYFIKISIENHSYQYKIIKE